MSMTPEAQLITIAEACGFTQIVPSGAYSILCGYRDEGWSRLPDYLSDLNAMHEVEKVLTQDQREHYWGTLCGMIDNQSDTKSAVSATATQRAEAFLRTLNLWDDKA